MNLPHSIDPQLVRISREQLAPYQASKWLSVQFLVDSKELAALFDALGNFGIYLTGTVLKENEGRVLPEVFLSCYETYIAALEAGQLPDETALRTLFSSALSTTPKALCSMEVGAAEHIIRPQLPVLQLQMHKIGYSSVDHKFRPMVLGNSAIHWGLQASYPQIFRSPGSGGIEDVKDGTAFPNTALFKALQRWIRKNTLPTPFVAGGTRTNVPMRLGYNCFDWISKHPQLVASAITVAPLKGKVDA